MVARTPERNGGQVGNPTRAGGARPSPRVVLPPLCLSAVEVNFESDEFMGAEVAYPGDDAFDALRNRNDLFVYRSRGKEEAVQVLVVPLDQTPSEWVLSAKKTNEFLFALSRLLERRMIELLPKWQLRPTRWGLERIRRQDDLLDEAMRHCGLKRPNTLEGFHKYHRTVLRVRCEHFAGKRPRPVLTVEFKRHHEIDPTLSDLLKRGLDLAGLDVFERNDDGSKKWYTLVRVAGKKAVLEDDDGEREVDGTAHWLEPSQEVFSQIFQKALGHETYEALLDAEWKLRAKEVCGRGYTSRLSQVVEHLAAAGPLEIAPTIKVSFGSVFGLELRGRSPSATKLPPIEYCFSWDRTAISQIPASGLDKFGPFDGTRFDTKEPNLLVVCPADSRHDVDLFARRLIDGTARDGRPAFARGLVGTYRLTRVSTRFATVDLSGAVLDIGTRYVRVLRNELGNGKSPDIVIIVVRDDHAFIERDNPYLAAKGFLLGQGIPSQEVRLSKVQSSLSDLPYILRDIAVAFYAKLGGCPWTIRPTMPLTKEVVIGMAHAEFGKRHTKRCRYMGITTVFSSDGTYLLASGSPRCRYEDYSQELAKLVRDTLGRLAEEYGWGRGDIVRLVFHAPKPLRGDEIETLAAKATEALGDGIQFESAFLTIHTDHPYKVIAPGARGRDAYVDLVDGGRGKALVGECAPDRGTMVDLGRSKRLLCVTGPLLMKREGESIPQPLLIELHRSSTYTQMSALAQQVFQFTGLSWRSMLPVNEPVTIYYPHLIAKMLGRLSALPGWSDELLDTRLRRSRWFL